MIISPQDSARWYPLKYHQIQNDLITDDVRFKVVPAGRRCLAAGTLVSTPCGSKPIESLKVGDEVVGFNGQCAEVTTVSEIHDNGLQEVFELKSGGVLYLEATENHKLWCTHENSIDSRRPHLHGKFNRVKIGDITKRHRIASCKENMVIGGRSEPYAYAIGALLGDGCSRNNKATTYNSQKFIYISSKNSFIPDKVANILGGDCVKLPSKNHTYKIRAKAERIPYYIEWMGGRYAHEKIADWSVIDSWDFDSSMAFLAGVIDTDGSIYSQDGNRLSVQIGMQAKSVVEACRLIILKFFSESLTLHKDNRNKYVNGPVWYFRSSDTRLSISILKAIRHHLVQYQDIDENTYKTATSRPDLKGLSIGNSRIARTYDITVSNKTNLYILKKGGLVTSNSGKTEKFKRYLAKTAMTVPGQYFIAAPTRPQVKKIYWNDMKRLCFCSAFGREAVSETELIIRLPNGSTITLIGLDTPQRIEGSLWDGGGIDEIADVKAKAWPEHIAPALDTFNPNRPDYKPWCWLIGVPDGLNHYYEMAEYAKNANDPEWKLYTWHSADILPADTIAAAKRRMSTRQFKQEYEASFETATGKIYEDYSNENQTSETIAKHEQLYWMHDFNYSPMSSAVGVVRNDSLFILDEIILQSAVARQTALEFVDRYKEHENKTMKLYGDPAGKAGEKHGHASDYTEIEQVLRANGWTVIRQVKAAAPAIRDRQNAVRAKIKNANGEVSLFVNPERAPYCHKGLATVQTKSGSTFLEEDSEYQHVTTAIGYCIDYIWSVVYKQEDFSSVRPIRTAHRW